MTLDGGAGTQVTRAGFGLTEVGVQPDLDQYSRPCVWSCLLYRLRNERSLAGRPDITSGHFYHPPLTSLSHEFLYFLDGGVRSSWCLA